VRAWVALRASTVESRFEAMHPSGLTALVGRVAGTVDAGALETYPFRRDRCAGRRARASARQACSSTSSNLILARPRF